MKFVDIHFIFVYSVIFLSYSAFLKSDASRIIELSDRFVELRGDSTWLIMFYAPWCGHCKRLEPVWGHVAQALYGTEIRVGKVDCTRFTAVAGEFGIRGYPTIMYIQGDIHHIYKGDRVKNDIINYAIRMSSAPVIHISDTYHFNEVKSDSDLFFVYVGEKEGALWVSDLDFVPSILVIKDNTYKMFLVPDGEDTINMTLSRWINYERFPLFVKITHGNLDHFWEVDKILTFAVVNEDKKGNMPEDQKKFKDMFEITVKKLGSKYQSFQFGWTGNNDIANSIAMERLALPTILAVNTTSLNHYMPEEYSSILNSDSVIAFLDSVNNTTAACLGGNGFFVRLYRTYYNARMSLEDMWHGNPVLSTVLFGLPLGFLSLICYSILCADILDANDEEEDHEKKE